MKYGRTKTPAQWVFDQINAVLGNRGVINGVAGIWQFDDIHAFSTPSFPIDYHDPDTGKSCIASYQMTAYRPDPKKNQWHIRTETTELTENADGQLMPVSGPPLNIEEIREHRKPLTITEVFHYMACFNFLYAAKMKKLPLPDKTKSLYDRHALRLFMNSKHAEIAHPEALESIQSKYKEAGLILG